MENKELLRVFAFYKRKASLIKRIFLIIALASIFIDFSIFTIISNKNTAIWLYSLPIALTIVVILLPIINILLNKVNKEFKNEFLKVLVKTLDFDAIYTFENSITRDELKDSSILSYDDSFDYKFSDIINGKIYDYKYKSARLLIKKKDKNINYIPFYGRIFIIDYFDSLNFFVFEKNNDYSPNLSDPKFEDENIIIYSNDFEKSKRILRNQIINKLSKYINKKNMKITIQFVNNKIIITTFNKIDNYALSEMSTINNIEQDYVHEMNIIKEILDILEI